MRQKILCVRSWPEPSQSQAESRTFMSLFVLAVAPGYDLLQANCQHYVQNFWKFAVWNIILMISKHATRPVWIFFFSLSGAAKVGHSLGMPNQAPAQLLPSRALSESFQDFLNLFQVGQSKSQRGRHAVILVFSRRSSELPCLGQRCAGLRT